MTTMNACLAGPAAVIGVWTVTKARAEAAATARHGNVVAFCQTHPNVDFPDRLFFGPGYPPGAIPRQLLKLNGSLKWRCMEGQVCVCSDSADGDWCYRKDANRRPSPLIRQACREDTERAPLSFADVHYSGVT